MIDAKKADDTWGGSVEVVIVVVDAGKADDS